MHFGVLVIVDSNLDPETAVEELLSPGQGDWWDWWTIGGRYTGCLNDAYDPKKDEANIETCSLCQGTGKRADMEVANGCNGCQGKGKRVKWATQWAKHKGDVISVDDLPDADFFVVVTPYDTWHKERWEPWEDEKLRKLSMPPLEYLKAEWKGYTAVVVDCHN